MARDDPHFRLRIPDHLKTVIEQDAAAHGLSINAEIVSRIEQTIKAPRSSRYIGRIQTEIDRIVSILEASDSVIEVYDELFAQLSDLLPPDFIKTNFPVLASEVTVRRGRLDSYIFGRHPSDAPAGEGLFDEDTAPPQHLGSSLSDQD